MVLSREYPNWFFTCVSLVALDIGSHWLQMYAQLLRNKSSHKDVDELYYTNRIFILRGLYYREQDRGDSWARVAWAGGGGAVSWRSSRFRSGHAATWRLVDARRWWRDRVSGGRQNSTLNLRIQNNTGALPACTDGADDRARRCPRAHSLRPAALLARRALTRADRFQTHRTPCIDSVHDRARRLQCAATVLADRSWRSYTTSVLGGEACSQIEPPPAAYNVAHDLLVIADPPHSCERRRPWWRTIFRERKRA